MTATVPLALVAAELGVPPDQLTARLGDDVLVDSVGFRCVERATAARLIDEHTARQASAASRGRASRAVPGPRRAVRSRSAAPPTASPRRTRPGPARSRSRHAALAAMLVDDPDNQLNRTGRVLDEMLHQPGELTYHRRRPQ